jgi:murein DD-endopeptidase MepM/ murein hydrolase activator NlpD
VNVKKNLWKIILLLVIGLGLGWEGQYLLESRQAGQRMVTVEQPPAAILPTPEEIYPYVIPPNSTLNSVLLELDVSSQTIHQIVQAAKPISDLGRLKPGVRFYLIYTNPSDTSSEVAGIRFRFSPAEMLEVTKVNELWTAKKITEVVEKKIKTFSGVVTSSLWGSAAAAKMDPNLISDLAEVFAWQVDFAREVQVNDHWRLSVEQKLVKGEPVGWGVILAAEYESETQKYVGLLYHIDENQTGYFTPEGASLRRMFLKSPIRYGRISSRFTTKRFHPILQFNRPHLGVDYAAPIGTPVRAVGDGVAMDVGVHGGAGKMIRIRHNSEYATAYKHLSGFAKGVRAGVRILQGQIIGYVGTSGLSTGPHLHFEFFQGGRFVDPLGRKFPQAEPIPSQLLTKFKSEATGLLASLPEWSSAAVGKSGSLSPNTQPGL